MTKIRKPSQSTHQQPTAAVVAGRRYTINKYCVDVTRTPPDTVLSSPGTFRYHTAAALLHVVAMFSLTTRFQRIEWSSTLTGGGAGYGMVWYSVSTCQPVNHASIDAASSYKTTPRTNE